MRLLLLQYGFDENKLAKESIETIKKWLDIIYLEEIKKDIQLYNIMALSSIDKPSAMKVPHIKSYFGHKRQAWVRQQKKSG